jgi:hypothetical protein
MHSIDTWLDDVIVDSIVIDDDGDGYYFFQSIYCYTSNDMATDGS